LKIFAATRAVVVLGFVLVFGVGRFVIWGNGSRVGEPQYFA